MKGVECAFVGRLGRDAQIRRSSAGREWLSLGVIVGEGDDEQWISVASWSHTIQELVSQLTQGARVYVEGKIKLRSWLGEHGEVKFGLSVSASLVQPLALIGMNRPKRPRAGKAKLMQTSAAISAPLPFDDEISF